HPGRGHVDVEDPEAVALLVVGRHLEQRAVHADGHRRQPEQVRPRRPAGGEAVEVRWRTELVEPADQRGHRGLCGGGAHGAAHEPARIPVRARREAGRGRERRGLPGRRHCTWMLPFISARWPGKLQKNTYGPPSRIFATSKLTEADSPPPSIFVCAITRVSPSLTCSGETPMPSAAIPAMSASFETTTLWPIAVIGMVPTCLRLMVNWVQLEGTVIESTLYCIASLPSMVVVQSATTAGLLPLATWAGAVSTGAGSLAGMASAG